MPSGCNRTASRPPSPGQKFPIHAVPSSVANSTTRPYLPRRAQFAGKPTAKGPYVGNPGSWRNDVILFTLTLKLISGGPSARHSAGFYPPSDPAIGYLPRSFMRIDTTFPSSPNPTHS